MKRSVSLLLALVLVLSLLAALPASGSENAEGTLDYGNAENWAYFALGEDKDVDVFLICPTVDTRSERNSFDLNDKLKGKFVSALDMERGIYEETGRLFSPYYRQMSLNAYKLPEAERAARGGGFSAFEQGCRSLLAGWMDQARFTPFGEDVLIRYLYRLEAKEA